MADPTIVVRAAGDFRRLYGEMSKADSRFGKLGSSIKAGLAGSALAGTAAVVAFGVESVKQAAAAQQSIGATESVFGKYADTVIARSKEAANAVGLSANEYRELNNVTGATLAATGLPLRRVADLTDKLTGRAADLAATFGGTTKEAIEAVSSLLRGEADPIERYGVSIKQSDVNARLAAKGLDKLEGSAKKQAEQQARLDLLFKQTKKSAGQFARESDTLGGAQQRLGAKVDDLEASFGELLLPVLTEGVNLVANKVVPKLQDLRDYVADNRDEMREFGGTVKDTVLPPLETSAELVKKAAELFGELPAPLKEIAVQAGIAAVVMPKLAAGVGAVTARLGLASAAVGTFSARIAQNRAAMTYATGFYGKAQAALHGFGGAARSVAGVGGFLALTQGAGSSNKAISALSTTAGGAAIGFSVGGPWGAAIGGAAGLLYGLKKATQESDEAAKVSNTTWQTYASTLDDVTGATTRATKAMIIQDLQQSDLLKLANQFDVSQQTIVNGILGQSKARERLNQIIKEQQDAIAGLESDPRFNEQSTTGKELQQEASDRRKLVESIKAETGELREGLKTKAQELALLNNIPERVATKIQAEGADLTARQIGRLASAYNLTPKQIRTVIKLSGTDATKADVDRIKARLDSVSDVDAGRKWSNRFTKEIQGARPKASAEINGLKGLLGGAGDVKPSFTKFNAGLSGGINSAKGTARSGGYQVGVNLGDGFSSGVQSRASILAAIARNTVLGAISVANKAADIRSPSRKTRYTGEMLGAGMEAGLRARQGAVRKAGKTLAQAVLAGVDDGADGVSKSIEKITAAVRKAITGKNQGKREAAYLKTLRDEFAALRANGRQQDVVAGKLERARDRLKELTDEYRDYARAIRDTVTATGDVTQLGRQDDGTVAIKSLLTELTGKVLGAERFEVLIAKLAKDGLSKTSIQQLLDQGPEAALATAEAIAAGGAASIKEINALQDRLAKSGDRLGDLMADRYYGAGVDAAKGIVKGLEAQAKSLDRAAVRMANELVKAVKRALGIKSPSREFRSIADQVTEGLTLQLQSNGTYVKRSGAVMAAQLVKGFDVPTLSADVLAGGAASSQPVKLDITITSPAVDQLTQGKRMQATLDYARSNGVRGVTF